jgi:hypothetical protein
MKTINLNLPFSKFAVDKAFNILCDEIDLFSSKETIKVGDEKLRAKKDKWSLTVGDVTIVSSGDDK